MRGSSESEVAMDQENKRGEGETQEPTTLPPLLLVLGHWWSQRLKERDPTSSRGTPDNIHAWRTAAAAADGEEREEKEAEE